MIDIKSDKFLKNLSCIDLSIRGAAYIQDDNLIYEKVEMLYDDEILKRIKHNELQQSDKFVQNYGFQFRYQDSFSKRQISDLWRWMKKVYFSKQNTTYDILINLNKQLESLYNQPCEQIYGFETFTQKNEFFNAISWKDINKFKLKEMYKKESYAKVEFTRLLFFKAINFQFETIIDLIDELQREYMDKQKFFKFNDSENKEINFIKRMIQQFQNVLTNKDSKQISKEIQILQETIKSLDLEINYLRFIQLFLSGDFLKQKDQIMELQGVNFFDRLIFVMKFLNKDSQKLIQNYKLKSIENGRLEAISLFAEEQEQIFKILQTYLDNSYDILTVGLSSIILTEIYPSLDLNKFTSSFNTFINDLGLFNLKGIIKKELLVAKKLDKQQKQISTVDNNIILCFFCKREPNKVRFQNHMNQWNQEYLDKYTKICLSCSKSLNKCSVCLSVIEEKKFYEETMKNLKSNKDINESEFSNLILWCLNCHHGGHSDHLGKWFERNDICPVFRCDCSCNLYN